jgi:hypothetical protein
VKEMLMEKKVEGMRYIPSVADPWHFGTDSDPHLWRIPLRIRILLFSSVILKTPTKFIFVYYLLKIHLHHISEINKL